MSNLSKQIEAYLKLLLEEEAGTLEINRSTLSETFSCVPSQINYVLSTRFTIDKGYLVESRRGGGGYVRITTIPFEEEYGLEELINRLKNKLNEQESEGVLEYLKTEQVISESFKNIFLGLMSERVLGELSALDKPSEIRSVLLKHLLIRLTLLDK